MIELILARHAKSDWGEGLPDHERPLNARGRRDAPAMAARLARSGAGPALLLSSTAVRARTTAAEFGAALGLEVELDPELYLAPAATLLEKAVSSGAASVMLVAHDPGLSELAALLSERGIERMPTCAVARFRWRVDAWGDAEGPADEWEFDAPREG